MADCNNSFLEFNKKITPTQNKKTLLKDSRVALENKITDYFKKNTKYATPSFYIQGSYKMGTMIYKKDGTYDTDQGVYFDERPTETCTTMQKHVYNAVKDHTKGGEQHKARCIRVIYSGDFNIDLPVYYQGQHDKLAKMAIKGGDWRVDDPEAVVEWFESKKDKDGQLVRVVKYLKRWATERGFKMPSGIALTVWAANYFVAVKGRDDRALYNVLNAMQNNLSTELLDLRWNLKCKCPVEPFDNLLHNIDGNQKDKFLHVLKSFRADAERALSERNIITAANIWRNHLGELFPRGV
jgi:hypothetical protein